eukprot:12683686-Heterocapsa_arctica.AAC.1
MAISTCLMRAPFGLASWRVKAKTLKARTLKAKEASDMASPSDFMCRTLARNFLRGLFHRTML